MIDRNKKFRKLAILRVNKAINSLRLIGNLSNKNNYPGVFQSNYSFSIKSFFFNHFCKFVIRSIR